MRVWYDITNTPQVHFLLAIDRIVKEIDEKTDSVYTAREFSETSKLLADRVGKDEFKVIGTHRGKSYIKKVLGLFSRFSGIASLRIDYDVSISCGSESAVWNSFIRRKQSVAFGDNDQARQWTYAPFVNYALFPKAIDRSILERQGLRNKLYQYDGFKEDIYLSYFKPDSHFLSILPFDEYVVVRPENIMANYIRNGRVESITPTLLKALEKKGYNILYLPRYELDKHYADGIRNIFIPDSPINGLDACFFATAVLTGAGTFAREAACLGIPSFSFYSGKALLSVDKELIQRGKMVFSRDVDILISSLTSSHREDADLSRSRGVKEEVSSILKELLF